MSMNQKYFCLAANPSANDGTAVNKGGYISIGGTQALAGLPSALRNFPFQLHAIKNGSFKQYAAEVLRIVNITPTVVNSTDYRVVLSAEKGQEFSNNLPNEVQSVFTHTTPASGGSRETIVNAFISAINKHPYWTNRVAASSTGAAGSEVLTITAKATHPIFNAAGGPNLSAAVGTAGSPEYGAKGADLLATNLFTTETGKPVSGQVYSVMTFEVKNQGESVLGSGAEEKYTIYFNFTSGTNNWAALITALSSLLVK